MFREFIIWAFAVTGGGNFKECRMIYFTSIMQAYVDKDITWEEYCALYNIVRYNIKLRRNFRVLNVM